MSFDTGDYVKFVEEQAQFMLDSNKKVIERGIEYHSIHCEDVDHDKCEPDFMLNFITLMKQLIEAKMTKMGVGYSLKDRLN